MSGEVIDVTGMACTYSQVARLPTVVTTTGTGTAQPQGWAVGLNVTQSLTVIALLGLSGPWERALVRLVARLLAVVAKAFGRGANFGVVTDVATFVAGTARERRHLEDLGLLSNIQLASRCITCVERKISILDSEHPAASRIRASGLVGTLPLQPRSKLGKVVLYIPARSSRRWLRRQRKGASRGRYSSCMAWQATICTR